MSKEDPTVKKLTKTIEFMKVKKCKELFLIA